MNLVAKEFVGARDDERGVLVLSQFAGAARQLSDALIVNPYAIEESAHALGEALDMRHDEQARRMRRMRASVAESSAYWWAGQMLQDAARLRQARRGQVA
jgi:trehalose 6-phosphate synthase